MKVALICIGRLENRYAIEFVEYYKQLGFDHIFIGDNNDNDEEYFEDVLQKYIDEKYITIIDLRGQLDNYPQRDYYLKTYYKYNNEYDWFAFFDFDEYLTLEKDVNIKNYLSQDCFKNYNQILINWRVYTDNDLVYDDGKPCLERFTTPMETYKPIWYENPLNEHVKPIIRNNIKNILVEFPHCINGDILKNTTCNNIGQQVNIFPFIQINYDFAYIKHFLYKTIDEYINNKLKKFKSESWELKLRENQLQLNMFFKINNLTNEKIKYLENKGYNYNNE